MSNDLNNTGPKPTQPPTGSKKQPSQSPEEPINDSVFDLSSLEDLPFSSVDAPRVDPVPVNEPLDPPSATLPPLSTSLSFDLPAGKDDPNSGTMGIPIGALPDLLDVPASGGLSGHGHYASASPDYSTGSSDSLELPIGEPLSSAKIPVSQAESESSVPLVPKTASGSSVLLSTTGDDSGDALGNLEPIAPVAPASGWLSAESEAPRAVGDGSEFFAPLEVHQADLFDAPPAIESSDIFSAGPIPSAVGADQSDVIAATAYAPEAAAASGTGGRPSEIALNFQQPPGGSTIHEEGGSVDLPIAEEVADAAQDTIAYPQLAETPVEPSSKRKANASEETADYGAMPMATPDASSILSDLSDPGDIVIDESSSVRLEAPGVGRTVSHTSGSSTEFDLTISEDPIFPELDAAASDSSRTETEDWEQQSGSDLFADRRTAGDIDLDEQDDRVSPIDVSLKSDEPSLTSSPSSIFSGDKLPVVSTGNGPSSPSSDSVRIGRPAEEEDAAVEFSDHPVADPESASAVALAAKNPSEVDESPDSRKSKRRPAAKEPPDDQESGQVDWNSGAMAEGPEATIGFPHALLNAPLSSILKREASVEDSDESPTALAEPVKQPSKKSASGPTDDLSDDGSDPSVEIDWMAGSSSEEPVVPAEVYEQQPTKTEKGKSKGEKKSPREKKRTVIAREPATSSGKKGSGGWAAGALIGMAVASAACAGVYFSGLVPNSATAPSAKVGGGETQPGPEAGKSTTQAPLSLAEVHAAIHSGEPAKALKALDAARASNPDQFGPEARAALGQARLFARVQSLARDNSAKIAADDAELKQARADLQAVLDDPNVLKAPGGELATAKATLHLGLAYELANEQDRARTIYEEGLKKLPHYSGAFQAALDRLAATASTSSEHSLRLDPADLQQLLFAVMILEGEEGVDEAGIYFWKAVNLANQSKYGEAVEEIKKAKAVHLKQARLNAGRGLNPLSDPLEQIFPRSCDDLKSYWELRAAIYSNKTVAEAIKKDGVEKTLNELAAAKKKATEAVKTTADLKEATDKLAKLQQDLKATQDSLAIMEKQSAEKELQAKAELDKARTKLQAHEAELDKAKAKIQTNESELDKAKVKLQTNEMFLKKTEEVNAAIARELQNAKLLGARYDTQALLAAQKTAMDRASGPNLSTLLPPGMMTIAGGGLSAGHLTSLADRLAKAESTAKLANEKLISETRRLSAEQDEAIKKIKESHAAEVKKLTDGYGTEMKKTMDAYTASTAKIKEEQAAEIKKMSDKFAADFKKLSEDNAAAAKAINMEYEAKVAALNAAVAREKAAGEAALARLRLDIRNSISPAQTLDLWLPQLSELRRPADAEPALATARNVLAASPPESETAAKAHTVAGLAHLLQGDPGSATRHFEQARSSPAYKAAAGKEWTRTADIGLASVTDPLADYRLPVEKPRRDVKLATHMLDMGIQEFKAGRYAKAQDVFVKSTQADSTDPVAWYFLGATRWALGAADQAKEDYRQGAEREKNSSLPARILNEFLEPIQGSARDALTVLRP